MGSESDSLLPGRRGSVRQETSLGGKINEAMSVQERMASRPEEVFVEGATLELKRHRWGKTFQVLGSEWGKAWSLEVWGTTGGSPGLVRTAGFTHFDQKPH